MAKKFDTKGARKFGARKRGYRFTCDRCGKGFTSKRRDACFCSAGCRKIVQRARDKYTALKAALAKLEEQFMQWGANARPEQLRYFGVTPVTA